MKKETFCSDSQILRIINTPNGYAVGVWSDGKTAHFYREELASIADAPNASLAAKQDAADILRQIADDEKRGKEAEELRAMCKGIAEELETVAGGDCIRCPHCGELHSRDDFEEIETEDEDGDTVTAYKCPHCGEVVEDLNDCEEVSLYEYLADNFGIEYRIDDRGNVRSVSIMVACGGPNIYIDTKRGAVCLYWWESSAQYPIDCAESVESWAAEMWEATR